MAFDIQRVAGWRTQLEALPPEEVLRWAVATFPGRVGMTCSFGGGGVVLAHMVSRIAPEVPVIFLNTSFHFPETLRLRDELTARYGLNLVEVEPALTVEEQATRYGAELYATDPDRCCALRKVEPLRRALAGLDCWISGLRRDQSPARRSVHEAELHFLEDGRPLLKVHPLAGWTRRQVRAYMERHGVPHHPLLDRGYPSIGCWPCTQPAAGGGERDGRWAGHAKTECGIHTFTRRVSPAGEEAPLP